MSAQYQWNSRVVMKLAWTFVVSILLIKLQKGSSAHLPVFYFLFLLLSFFIFIFILFSIFIPHIRAILSYVCVFSCIPFFFVCLTACLLETRLVVTTENLYFLYLPSFYYFHNFIFLALSPHLYQCRGYFFFAPLGPHYRYTLAM